MGDETLPSVLGAADLDDRERTETVDLSDGSLVISIADALTQGDKIKFTIQTQTTMKEFKKQQFSVERLHEEFVFVHQRLTENDRYAGFIIPPAPPRPDFSQATSKLQNLQEVQNTLTKEEYAALKKDVQQEYLSLFKKTVAMHEVFLQRLAVHKTLREDENFRAFLEYENELCVRQQSRRDKVRGVWRSALAATDELVMLRNYHESDEYFEKERSFLTNYVAYLQHAGKMAETVSKAHRGVAEAYLMVSNRTITYATSEDTRLRKMLMVLCQGLEETRKRERTASSNFELKSADTLTYQARNSTAAQQLLYRRIKSWQEMESSRRALEKARAKNRDVDAAETVYGAASERFNTLSESAREEMNQFQRRRVEHFQKNLRALAELNVKSTQDEINKLKSCINAIEAL